MSEAADLIAELRGRGITRKAIAQTLDRSPRMVNKVQTGATAGKLYLPQLRAMVRGDVPPPPPPRGTSHGQRQTPAGRYTHVTGRGLVGLYQALAADRLDGAQRTSLVVEYLDSHGNERTTTLWRNGGIAPGAILDDLEALGARPGDAASIRRAIIDLVHGVGVGHRQGRSGGVDVRTIVSVRAMPHGRVYP